MTVTKSQLDKMLLKNKQTITLNSRYDPRKAAIIVANKELVMNALATSGTSRSKCKEGDHLWAMLEWQARYGKIEGSKVKYDMAKGASFGRLYPVKSVHGYVQITRSVRHYLARDIYTDVDIDNCHPVLIEQLFPLIVQRESPYIKYWNNNRSELFSRMQQEAKLSGISLTRDQCKEVGFVFLYGGNMEKEFQKLGLTLDADPKSVWTLCNNLSKDMLLFTTRFADVYRDVFDNLGSIRNAAKLSIVMQHIERHLALLLIEVAESMNLEVGDICHDGVFLSQHGSPVSKEICEDLFFKTISHIKKHTGFTVNLSIKEMAAPTWESELHVIKDEVLNDDDDGDFKEVVQRFELNHAKIVNKSTFLKFLPNDLFQLFSVADLKTSYGNMKFINGRREEQPFLTKWLNYKNMRTYEDFVIEPPGVIYPANCLNLWSPFPPERILTWKDEQDSLQLILNHIKILCNHDELVYSYVINWIGQMIQYPSVKSTCITLISDEGAGKGTLIDFLRLMLGDNRVFKTSFPSRDCWGMFNGQMSNAFLVNLDELSKKETLEAEGQIKTLVADDTLTINNKGKGQYTIKSYHRFIITTNNEDPIKTTTGDRRKLIIRSSDELCPIVMGTDKSFEYFQNLRKHLNNPDVIKTAYEYFKNLEGLDRFNSIAIPATEHQQNLKQLSKSPIECWIEDFVSRSTDNTTEQKSSDLYSDFCSWSSVYNKEYKIPNYQAFTVKLSNLKIAEITIKKTKFCNVRVFDIAALRVKFGMLDPTDCLLDE